ncbi:MAG: hypothetical protein OEV86_15995, partial [Candidatus Krumholzibacteria bacterium]|nr:hypothetical protein [Candidatus Krumholzibacteria bacterium]
MNLRSIFPLVAAKKLVAVDLPNHGSNQHEINGVADLRELFSGEKRNEPIQWAYFADDREPVWETGTVTFYDARAKSHERTGRSEWRLYYYGDFIAHATEGDVLVLARRSTGELYGLVFQAGSAWLTAASSLFSLEDLTPKML